MEKEGGDWGSKVADKACDMFVKAEKTSVNREG